MLEKSLISQVRTWGRFRVSYNCPFLSDGEGFGQKLNGRAEDGQDGEGEEGAGREEGPPETAQLSKSGRKMRKKSCSCCK